MLFLQLIADVEPQFIAQIEIDLHELTQISQTGNILKVQGNHFH